MNSNLSHEVNRIGYHFPSLIVEKACFTLGISLTQSFRALSCQNKTSLPCSQYIPSNQKKKARGKSKRLPKSNISQATLDTQAREAIKDLFPKIPDIDLHEIIRRAFEKV